jgi:hypothetical protein
MTQRIGMIDITRLFAVQTEMEASSRLKRISPSWWNERDDDNALLFRARRFLKKKRHVWDVFSQNDYFVTTSTLNCNARDCHCKCNSRHKTSEPLQFSFLNFVWSSSEISVNDYKTRGDETIKTTKISLDYKRQSIHSFESAFNW